MQLRFHTAASTRVRFFANAKALEAKLATLGGYTLADRGAPLRLPGARRLPRGEDCKRFSELGRALEWLREQRAERSAPLIGVGGGAALDLSAFVASLYRRGMPLFLVPTTLLGMVDATLGGKTAVDGEDAAGRLQKNFAGTFYPAREVWINFSYLASLPRRERLSGAGECWKTLWIAGRAAPAEALFRFVAGAPPSAALGSIIKKCLQEKRRVVELDPLDLLREREILNYGHTVGHALESLGRGRIAHGECVLWGMLVESAFLGKAGAPQAALVRETLARLGLSLPEEFAGPGWEKLLGADKKMHRGRLSFTALAAPGKPRRLKVEAAELAKFIRAFPKSYRP